MGVGTPDRHRRGGEPGGGYVRLCYADASRAYRTPVYITWCRQDQECPKYTDDTSAARIPDCPLRNLPATTASPTCAISRNAGRFSVHAPRILSIIFIIIRSLCAIIREAIRAVSRWKTICSVRPESADYGTDGIILSHTPLAIRNATSPRFRMSCAIIARRFFGPGCLLNSPGNEKIETHGISLISNGLCATGRSTGPIPFGFFLPIDHYLRCVLFPADPTATEEARKLMH